jgi:hypothetical protein
MQRSWEVGGYHPQPVLGQESTRHNNRDALPGPNPSPLVSFADVVEQGGREQVGVIPTGVPHQIVHPQEVRAIVGRQPRDEPILLVVGQQAPQTRINLRVAPRQNRPDELFHSDRR